MTVYYDSCEDAAQECDVLYPAPQPSTVLVNFHQLTARYIDMLNADGVPDPLNTPLTAAAVINDLCNLAGVPTPPDVWAALEVV